MNNTNTNAANLTGNQIIKAMRAYRVTISQVAQHMGVSKARVSVVRRTGVVGINYVRDWMEGVSGARLT